MSSNKDIDQALAGEIHISDESWKVLKTLCRFGGRAGSTGSERQAVKFMLEKFQEYGLENPQLEEFEFLGWIRGSSKLEIISPLKQEIPCLG